MTTVKILKSERAIISETVAEWCLHHSFSEIEGDKFFINLNLDTDSAIVCWHIGQFCGEKVQEAIQKRAEGLKTKLDSLKSELKEIS